MIDEEAIYQKARYLAGEQCGIVARVSAIKAARILQQLQNAATSGSSKRVRAAQNQLLKSVSVKLCCVVLSVKRKEKDPLLLGADLVDMAVNLSARSDCSEPVYAYAKIKSARGDWRPICKFGPKRKALQTLIGLLIDAKFGPHPLDYMARGRGIDAATDHLTQLINAGENHFVVADIADCFRSVKQEEIAERLGLPVPVVRHCLLIGKEVPVRLPQELPVDTNPEAFSGMVRQGLPQGARSSNRVMSQLLGPELGSLTLGDGIVLYGDDFAVPAKTREEARALAQTLPEFFEAHPAGPFRLKRCEVVDARTDKRIGPKEGLYPLPASPKTTGFESSNEPLPVRIERAMRLSGVPSQQIQVGFNFLQYNFRRDPVTGRAKVRPSTLSYHRFAEKVRQIVRDKPINKVCPRVLAYRHNWLKSFRRYEANQAALNLLWLSAIDGLPDHLYAKWRDSCRSCKASGDTWLEPVERELA